MPPPLRVCLFDLDGCLLHSIDLIRASFHHATLTCLGAPAPLSDIDQWLASPLHVTFQRLAPEDPALAERLLTTYRAHNIEHHDALVKRVPGMLEAIAQLHARGLKLAVVTSKVTHLALRGLEVAGLREFFSVVVGVEQCEQHKPHPAPALAALQLLGEAPGPHVAFIGDAPSDIACGHASGCGLTVAVGWTAMDRAAFVEAALPSHWVHSAEELGEVLLRAAAAAAEGAAGAAEGT